MSKLQTPFRYDFVGSFLRPEKLKEARGAEDDCGIAEPSTFVVAEKFFQRHVVLGKKKGPGR